MWNMSFSLAIVDSGMHLWIILSRFSSGFDRDIDARETQVPA